MVKYRIFQVKKDLMKYYGFNSLATAKAFDYDIDLENYDLVYEGSIDNHGNVLEELFRIFNVNRPKDFHGCSMSISDVVQINNKFFYCDTFGWKDITNEIIP